MPNANALLHFLSGKRPRANPDDPDDAEGYLYHVTFAGRLGGIAEDGLLPAGGGGFAGIGNHSEEHKRRGVFLTELAGVLFWLGRAQLWGEHSSDRVLDDGYVPVCLRMPRPAAPLEADEVGTSDARAPAWIAPPVAPDVVEAWNGAAWVPVDSWDEGAASLGVDLETQDGDDGEPEVLQWLKDSRSPLTPPEAR